VIAEKAIFLSDRASKHGAVSHKIGAGTKEWNFSFEIPGNTEESVEGLNRQAYIIYELYAVLDGGRWTKDLKTTKHMRIVRTLANDTDSLPSDQVSYRKASANPVPKHRLTLFRLTTTYGKIR
jgi:hypothetical protein